MGTPAPDAIISLVNHFDLSRKVFQSGDYKEEQLRAEFLNPPFAALGWDMDKTFDKISIRNRVSVILSSEPTLRVGTMMTADSPRLTACDRRWDEG